MIKKLSITLLLSLLCSVGFSQTCKDSCSHAEGAKKEKSRKERKAENSSCSQIQSCNFSGGQDSHSNPQCQQTVSIPVCFLDTSKCNAQDCCGDLDRDGKVTASDLLIFLNNYPSKGEESKRCCER